MLNRSHAQVSLKYNKMLQKLVGELRHLDVLRPRFDWIVARFVRWCALHASGGGWMSDYDVLNLGFTPEAAGKFKDALVVAGNPAHLFYVSADNAQNVLQKLLSEQIIEEEAVKMECDILKTSAKTIDCVKRATVEKGASKSLEMKRIWDDFLGVSNTEPEKLVE